MGFTFKEKERNKGEGKIKYVEILNENKKILRKATFRILNTEIIYNEEEDFFYTLAACSNENNLIETISIEGFNIIENVTDFKGAYIDYEEYEKESEMNYIGTIYYL
ncbi:hypothetical protein [Clostridium psychrophilum]|uniref:hypothetical protein n=1 Tax=Clostridium psychrophilum TaxID=132926 RepID=UPI001C0E0D88|nr:hypothetical protein [Clostridium psychrophilum]MBU3181437.1 hypothetical protein [Clostridium psychrophilum]